MVETLTSAAELSWASQQQQGHRTAEVPSPQNGGHWRTERGYSYKQTENTITWGEAVYENDLWGYFQR